MILTYGQTKALIDLVLASTNDDATLNLNNALANLRRSVQEFYESVIQHGQYITYTSDQWLDFHQKVPHWRLQEEKSLMDKLSPKHRSMLRTLAPD